MTSPGPLHPWLAAAMADADRRGLADLKPLLESLAAATAQLRRADWNDEATGRRSPAPPSHLNP